jgi:hypothetical protein
MHIANQTFSGGSVMDQVTKTAFKKVKKHHLKN